MRRTALRGAVLLAVLLATVHPATAAPHVLCWEDQPCWRSHFGNCLYYRSETA